MSTSSCAGAASYCCWKESASGNRCVREVRGEPALASRFRSWCLRRHDLETARSQLNGPHLAFRPGRRDLLAVQKNRHSSGIAQPQGDLVVGRHGANFVWLELALEDGTAVSLHPHPNLLFSHQLHLHGLGPEGRSVRHQRLRNARLGCGGWSGSRGRRRHGAGSGGLPRRAAAGPERAAAELSRPAAALRGGLRLPAKSAAASPRVDGSAATTRILPSRSASPPPPQSADGKTFRGRPLLKRRSSILGSAIAA